VEDWYAEEKIRWVMDDVDVDVDDDEEDADVATNDARESTMQMDLAARSASEGAQRRRRRMDCRGLRKGVMVFWALCRSLERGLSTI